MQELPQKWKESITVPIYMKGDKTDCCNYRGISHAIFIQILFIVRLSRLTLNGKEIFGNHQCGFGGSK
jgi:hypothetical protein